MMHITMIGSKRPAYVYRHKQNIHTQKNTRTYTYLWKEHLASEESTSTSSTRKYKQTDQIGREEQTVKVLKKSKHGPTRINSDQ